MQGCCDSASIFREIRCGRVEKVKEIITKYGLSHRPWCYGYTLLREAVKRRQVDVVKLLIAAGSRPNSKSSRRMPCDTPLHIAVANGDLDVVKLLVVKGADVNAINNEGKTPLHVAVGKSDMEVTELLVTHGSRVSARSIEGKMPVHIAVERQCFQIVEYLIKCRADVNSGLTCSSNILEGYPPLHLAVEKGCEELVKLLLSGGAMVNAKGDGITPLHIAAEKGYSQIARHLLGCGADINCHCTRKGHEDYTPMHFAVKAGKREIVEILLRSGAKANDKGKDNMTPLHIAAERGFSHIAEHLLEHGADLNATCASTSCDGFTPLHSAAIQGSTGVAILLMEYGASANTQDNAGKTPLLLAVENGHSELVKHIFKGPDMNNQNKRNLLIAAVTGNGKKIIPILLEYGFEVTPEFVSNQELLFTAVEKAYVNIVELLLQNGADVNKLYNYKSNSWLIRDCGSCTPLHVAVRCKLTEVAALLVKFEADVNAPDESGKASLYYAVKNADLQITKLLLCSNVNLMVHPELLLIATLEQSKEIIEVLLDHGADANFCNDEGKTALLIMASCKEYSYSCQKEHNIRGEITKLLLSRGANVNGSAKSGKIPLNVAAENGYEQVVRALLEFKADVNSKDKNGLTSLHIAAVRNRPEVVKTLLEFGAMIDSTDEDGMTSLHLASKNGHVSIVSNLLKYGSDINIASKNNCTPLDFAKAGVSLSQNRCMILRGLRHTPFRAICDILECHIVKMETANMYVSGKNLSLIDYDKCSLMHIRMKCEFESLGLRLINVGNSKVSWSDILRKSAHQLASLLSNDNIAQSLSSSDYVKEFVMYGNVLRSLFRRAERRKKLLDEIKDYSLYVFPKLPWECTWEVLSNLTDNDIQNLINACRPTDICTSSTKTMMQ